MDLEAAYRPRGDTVEDVTYRTFTGDDYDVLAAQARAEAPDGQILLHLRRTDR